MSRGTGIPRADGIGFRYKRTKVSYTGDPEQDNLIGEEFDYDEELFGAYTFTKHFSWIRDTHEVSLKVWVPLPDGKVYEMEFNCASMNPAPNHSGL